MPTCRLPQRENGDPLHLFFSNVAVKLVGSNTWMDAR
jgi:hypothetical protein